MTRIAVNYQWRSGPLSSSGVPVKLGADDIVNIASGGSKAIDVNFETSGAVTWSDVVLAAFDRSVTNYGQWSSPADTDLSGAGSFINLGSLRKSGGTGLTRISTIGLYSRGAFIADSGTLVLNGGAATYDAGTSFQGSGHVQVVGNADFISSFSSQNLQLVTGNFTGHNAFLMGQAEQLGGNLAGGWIIAPTAQLNLRSGSAKGVTGTLVLLGTLHMEDALSVSGQVRLDSGGVFDIANDSSVSGAGQLALTGTLRKSAGGGASTFAPQISGAGQVLVQSGVLKLSNDNHFSSGVQFNGSRQTQVTGTARVAGTLFSQNLVLAGGNLVGDNAVMHGNMGCSGRREAASFSMAASTTRASCRSRTGC